MKNYVAVLFFLVSICCFANPQADVKVYYEYTPDGYALFASNAEEFPVIVELDFELQNLKVVRKGPSKIVVPAEAKKHKLLNLVAINRMKGYNFEFTFKTTKVDESQKEKEITSLSDSTDTLTTTQPLQVLATLQAGSSTPYTISLSLI